MATAYAYVKAEWRTPPPLAKTPWQWRGAGRGLVGRRQGVGGRWWFSVGVGGHWWALVSVCGDWWALVGGRGRWRGLVGFGERWLALVEVCCGWWLVGVMCCGWWLLKGLTPIPPPRGCGAGELGSGVCSLAIVFWAWGRDLGSAVCGLGFVVWRL